MGKQFNTVEDVKAAFLNASGGSDSMNNHSGVRYEDIDKYKPIVERLLDTDYNNIHGFNISEIVDAISSARTNYSTNDYINAYRSDKKSLQLNEALIAPSENDFISEAFEGTNVAQAPYPVPAISLVTYQYEKTVLPFLAHQFDLKGNQGLIYFQEMTAMNSEGNITAGDLLESPKDLGAQPVGFVGSKVINEALGATQTGVTAYTFTLANKPIQPGTLVITLQGAEGYFQDVAAVEARQDLVALLSVNGNLGTCTVVPTTGVVTINLANVPASAGLAFKATYNRDLQTITGGTNNAAEITVDLKSKFLKAEDFSVKTQTNLQQEALSRAVFGREWNAEVDRMMGCLYNKEIANKIISEIAAKIPTASQATHDMTYGITAGGNNPLFSVQFVGTVLSKLRRMIANASGIQAARLSAIVVENNTLVILENLPKYRKADVDTEDLMGGMALVGMYDGIPVIVGYQPILAQGDIFGLYKSRKQDFLAPYAFGTFILPLIRETFDQNNLSTNRKQLIASAAGEVVAEKLASHLSLTGIDTII